MSTSQHAEILAWLARAPVFAPLDDAGRQAVAREMRPISYQAGQAIFARGDVGRDVYLVTKGRVRLSVLTSEGRELSFAHAEAGALFGEIAMLDGGPRTADATAVTAVAALVLSKASFARLMQSQPPLAEAVIRFLCQRLREADQQLEAIALYPIEVRLARFFLASARQKTASKEARRVVLDLGMSQSELALLIGASRPKVNAALSYLESSGALSRADNRITCDLDELAAIADVAVD